MRLFFLNIKFCRITTGLTLLLFSLFLFEKQLSGAETLNEIPNIKKVLSGLSKKLITTRQILVVTTSNPTSFIAKLYAYEKEGADWKIASGPTEAVIGKSGFALPNQKKEGDHKSPTGVFSLERAFGYDTSYPTKMSYTQMTEEEVWVDDVHSPDYNRLVKKGMTQAVSFEKMKRKDHLYKYGIVIEYNTDPVVKGKGSAIFIHLLRGPDKPTEGCVAINENNMIELLGWLDSEKRPVILMGLESYLEKL
jgi:L,D-peptidoglycan transpeptidase YkuD (ErfK/YbiS/YcfS/YnhG family)